MIVPLEWFRDFPFSACLNNRAEVYTVEIQQINLAKLALISIYTYALIYCVLLRHVVYTR